MTRWPICLAVMRFADTLEGAKQTRWLWSGRALTREDGASPVLIAAIEAFERKKWNGFNVLHTAAARVAGLDLGLLPGEGGLDVAAMQVMKRRA